MWGTCRARDDRIAPTPANGEHVTAPERTRLFLERLTRSRLRRVHSRARPAERGSAGELLPQCRVGAEEGLQILCGSANDRLDGVADDVHLARRDGGVRGDPALHLPGRGAPSLRPSWSHQPRSARELMIRYAAELAQFVTGPPDRAMTRA